MSAQLFASTGSRSAEYINMPPKQTGLEKTDDRGPGGRASIRPNTRRPSVSGSEQSIRVVLYFLSLIRPSKIELLKTKLLQLGTIPL